MRGRHHVDVAVDPVGVVRAMWDAERDGRTDDVIATMHPLIVWAPFTPGDLSYSGHVGIRRMRDAAHAVLGGPEIVIDEITLLADGTVLSRGRASSPSRAAVPFEARCEFRDGLIVGVYSRYRLKPT
ncbi:MAG: hypothetical protein QOG65_666 [Actinomycetota bacterium]|jgi:hypothetical protein|nr:hypothetical protein [Actinomycetota bacterium]MDQ1383287.1 hypothetical protein [Actinomycetota bacterium]